MSFSKHQILNFIKCENADLIKVVSNTRILIIIHDNKNALMPLHLFQIMIKKKKRYGQHIPLKLPPN